MAIILMSLHLMVLELLLDQSAGESILINGKSSFENILLLFDSESKGNLTIKSATIEYNGQVFKTNPVKLR
jgi:hypothetical protein